MASRDIALQATVPTVAADAGLRVSKPRAMK
jgi:hypothetical protein